MAREKDALPTDGSACNDAPGGRQDDSHVVQPEAWIRDPHEDEEVITMRSTAAAVIARRVAVEGVCGPCGGHIQMHPRLAVVVPRDATAKGVSR